MWCERLADSAEASRLEAPQEDLHGARAPEELRVQEDLADDLPQAVVEAAKLQQPLEVRLQGLTNVSETS